MKFTWAEDDISTNFSSEWTSQQPIGFDFIPYFKVS